MTPQLWIEVILAVAIGLTPIALLIHRTIVRKKDGAHFGLSVRMAQFTGAAMLPPALIILALEGIIDGSTVAALVGVYAGYLFSGIAEFDRRDRTTAKPEKLE